MNPYSILIPVIIIASWLQEIIVDSLNLTRLTPKLPKQFADTYSPQKYKKSQLYTRATTKFGLIESTFATSLTLLVIYSGVLQSLDLFARSFSQNPYLIAAIFITAIIIANTLINLPFSLYKTFVIEQKFGFNKTTTGTFAIDTLKSIILSALIINLLVLIISYFFTTFSTDAWIFAWITITLLQLFLTFIAPIVIMPIFNKFTPLPDSPLKTKIHHFARKQNFHLQGIFTMDGSKRSSKANAFFTGFGRYKRIVLFDTLIKNHTPNELLTILAHEIGHYKLGHIPQMLIANTLIMGATLYALGQLINNPNLAFVFGVTTPSIHTSLIFVSILLQPIFAFITPAINALSRRNEYQADAYAILTTQKPKTFIRALKKLSSDNLTNLTPHPLKVFFDYSHPPVLERIRQIQAIF